MALDGDATAMRLCMERVLPPCREPNVKFSLPPIEGTRTRETSGPSAGDIARAMDAVTSALAEDEITPGEAEKIAAVVDTFVRAIETTKKAGSGFNLLQILTAGSDDEDSCDEDDPEEMADCEESDEDDS